MEGFGVLRAASLAGVPAVEVRVVANAVGEPDRARWRFEEALDRLRSPCRRCPTLLESVRMRELPPPLPPAERTVGQLVGETIRAYGDNFWRSLPLGVPLAVVDAALARPLRERADRGAARVRAARSRRRSSMPASSMHDARPTPAAYACAVLVFAPVPMLVARVRAAGASRGSRCSACGAGGDGRAARLPRRARARPAARDRRLRARARLARDPRARRRVLGADARSALLRSQGDNGQRVAHVLADLVLSPLLYLGGALLYLDQAARVGSRRPRHEGDDAMPIFILLSTLTQQGVQTLKSNPERLRQVNQDVEELGCQGAAPVGDARRVRLRQHRRGARHRDGREGLGRARRARLDEDRDAACARDRGLPADARIATTVRNGHVAAPRRGAEN